MKRETIPISILYSTTGPYAELGREAVAGAIAGILIFVLSRRLSIPPGVQSIMPCWLIKRSVNTAVAM
jgi:hypothetical protein